MGRWPTSCHSRLSPADRVESMQQHTEKPTWVDALEESLLLAIVMVSLITWIVMLGVFAH